MHKLKNKGAALFLKLEEFMGEAGDKKSEEKKKRDKKLRMILPDTFRNFEKGEFIYPLKGLYVAQFLRLSFILTIFLGTIFIYAQQTLIETAVTNTLADFPDADGWVCERLSAYSYYTNDQDGA